MCKLQVFGDNNIFRSGNNQTISLKENRSEFIANNNNHKFNVVYKVDGGLINSNTVYKCDFLLIVQENNNKHTGYFIELKGEDLNHAFEQLDSTVDILYNTIFKYYKTNKIEYVYNGRIATTASVSQRNMRKESKVLFQSLHRKFKSLFKGDLDFKKTPYKESI